MTVSAERRFGRVAVVVALLALASGACGPPPLAGAAASPDELGRAVLAGLARRDAARLRAIALSEPEFRAHVWPALPAARPERNLPFGYVWGDLNQKSELSLAGLLGAHGGRAYELIGVRFEDPPRDYAGFRVHGHAVFDVRGAEGAAALRLCGSFLEQDGRWKVFSYVVE